jgi:predicted dehydrogenase
MPASSPSTVGIIGCGNISNAYAHACKRFAAVKLVACADLDLERAKAKAAEHGIPRVLTVDQLLADPGIDIVLNLTIPAAHAEIDERAIQSGKHAYSEKPFGLTRAQGERVVSAAKAKGRRVGCAPDTVLGGGTQTCRRLIDDGAIGTPIAFIANMLCAGHESWHPSPEFYYQKGGGPMFDMGPYYLHSLITLLGPVRRVTGSTRVTHATRTITSQPKKGTVVPVEVPTHVIGVLEFAAGPIGTITTSFDVRASQAPCIEVIGTEGTIAVPDPNSFGGPVRIRTPADSGWREVPLSHGHTGNERGLGLADMATAIATGRKHRANDEIAMHALDIMQAIHESSDTGRHVVLGTTCERPSPMVTGLAEGLLDP